MSLDLRLRAHRWGFGVEMKRWDLGCPMTKHITHAAGVALSFSFRHSVVRVPKFFFKTLNQMLAERSSLFISEKLNQGQVTSKQIIVR